MCNGIRPLFVTLIRITLLAMLSFAAAAELPATELSSQSQTVILKAKNASVFLIYNLIRSLESRSSETSFQYTL